MFFERVQRFSNLPTLEVLGVVFLDIDAIVEDERQIAEVFAVLENLQQLLETFVVKLDVRIPARLYHDYEAADLSK